MARFTINYLDGTTEHVTADGVEYDADARDYTFTGPDGKGVVALAPLANIRSVHREADQAAPKTTITYPYQDGDVIVLGPEVFASADGQDISWKGMHYGRTLAILGPVTD